MAELNVFVRDLEKELTCSICDDIFKDPKTLQCLHSFCFDCIAKWHEKCGSQRQRLTCPTCRSCEDDLSKLRSSFYLDALLQLLHAMRSSASKQEQRELPNCVSCQKRLPLAASCPQCGGMICTECVNAHKSMKTLYDEHKAIMFSDFNKEDVNTYIKNQAHCYEKFHQQNKLEYYCQTCHKCICQKCSQTAHTTHYKVSVEEKAEEIKGLINGDMERVSQLKHKYMRDLELLKQELEQFETEIKTTKTKVHDEIQSKIKLLQDHEKEVVQKLDAIFLEQKTTKDEEQREMPIYNRQLGMNSSVRNWER